MATMLLTEAFTNLVPNVGQVVAMAIAGSAALLAVVLTAKAWAR